MTYNDVYKKFMIEYDKADISSSYPSLTIYEVATILDKALLALISQKVTGNNPRQTVLDQDIKAAADIQQLLKTSSTIEITDDVVFSNEKLITVPDNLLYLLKVFLKFSDDDVQVAQIISQVLADKFRNTSTNKPWLKTPYCFLENGKIHILYDSSISNYINKSFTATSYYIKKPNMFTDKTNDQLYIKTSETIPLSDSACEELINLAIIYACKTVENPRITTETQIKSLEA